MKAVVLSSGGLDSTTCLALAIEKLGNANVSTVSIFYGQRHERELSCAKFFQLALGIALGAFAIVVELEWAAFRYIKSKSWRR